MPEELILLAFSDLAHVLDEWLAEQGRYDRLEVLTVHGVDLGRDLDFHTEALRDRNASVHALLGEMRPRRRGISQAQGERCKDLPAARDIPYLANLARAAARAGHWRWRLRGRH